LVLQPFSAAASSASAAVAVEGAEIGCALGPVLLLLGGWGGEEVLRERERERERGREKEEKQEVVERWRSTSRRVRFFLLFSIERPFFPFSFLYLRRRCCVPWFGP